MPSSTIIRVSEYEKLYYDEATPFTEAHWKALCHYLQQANRRNSTPVTYFQIIHKGIRFTTYVGVIQAGNLTIEILPKTDKATASTGQETEQQADKQRWHTVLLQMLGECKWLAAHPAGWAYLRLQKQSLLDVYLSAFLAEVEKLLHEDLLKKYEPEEGNQSALKGRLLFSKQVVKNAVHSERFYVSNATYDADTLFNQLLFKAVQLVQQISRNPALQHTAGSLLLSFPAMKPVAVSDDAFRQLTYNRKTERYRPAMQFAEMLLSHASPSISGGNMHTLALLFDMNALWEEWVYRQLKKEETAFGITVQRQQSAPFWEAKHVSHPATIRPDVVIRRGNTTIVLDTKWKQLVNGTPDADDLRQLFVYNLYWQAQLSVLLYPATDEDSVGDGIYTPLPQLGNATMQCKTITQSIFKGGRIDAAFGKRILEMILPKEQTRCL